MDGKSSQKYLANAGVPQGAILGPTVYTLMVYTLMAFVICNIAVYADDFTLCSKCGWASDL